MGIHTIHYEDEWKGVVGRNDREVEINADGQ
jgi:hypothetical protein